MTRWLIAPCLTSITGGLTGLTMGATGITRCLRTVGTAGIVSWANAVTTARATWTFENNRWRHVGLGSLLWTSRELYVQIEFVRRRGTRRTGIFNNRIFFDAYTRSLEP